MLTEKHKYVLNPIPVTDFDSTCKHQCPKCYKKYESQSGLWSHNLICLLKKNKLINQEQHPVHNFTGGEHIAPKKLREYIYLLQEREFINSNEKVYKVGKTRQLNFERFKQYPKGSVVLLYSECCDCDRSEKLILSMLRKKFIKRTDYGSEYFQGDCKEMKFEINQIVYNLDKILSEIERKIEIQQINIMAAV
jgi:hypothetical protein